MFKFPPFQLEDYSRFALHDGGVLAHDTGTGKSVAEFALPMLWCGFTAVEDRSLLTSNSKLPTPVPVRLEPNAPVLLVVPGDGHEQTRDEGRKHFRARVTTLDSQATFLRLSTLDPRLGTRQLPPGFYLTSYTQLTGNNVTPFPDLAACLDAPLSHLELRNSGTDSKVPAFQIEHPLFLTPEDVARFFEGREQRWQAHYQVLAVSPRSTAAQLKAQWFKLRKAHTVEAVRKLLDDAYEVLRHVAATRIEDLDDDQLDWLRRETIREKHKEYSAGIGESRSYAVRSWKLGDSIPTPNSQLLTPSFWTVKCCYDASLADLSSESFKCVSVDEGTKMKGEETIIGLGLRQMNPRYRLVLTATPIKNRLPDVFSLAVWASHAGPEGNARFSYGDTPECRQDFAKEFMLAETNLTKSAQRNQRVSKLTPQVTNIHRLWKLLATVILRRRKKDCGLAIVPKHRHVVRCPMGQHQAEVYKYHLAANYRDKNNLPAVGAKLQALRIVAANPASHLLEFVPDLRSSAKSAVKLFRSPYDFVPKLASVLGLLRDLLVQQEQVLVFSAFHDSLDVLSHRLREAGVAHVVCDGRMTQKQRGAAAKQFKKGAYPVMLASVECMAELHSFSQCSHVVLMCYSWAFDKFEQAINRIHRLDSPKDVHVWSFLCDGSIDGRLEGNIHEKSDSSELVLDGQLLGEQSTEVNLWELLRDAERSFNSALRTPHSALVDEHELEKTWPPLREAIALAAAQWRFGGTSQKPEARPLTADLRPPVIEPEFADLPLWAQA